MGGGPIKVHSVDPARLARLYRGMAAVADAYVFVADTVGAGHHALVRWALRYRMSLGSLVGVSGRRLLAGIDAERAVAKGQSYVTTEEGDELTN